MKGSTSLIVVLIILIVGFGWWSWQSGRDVAPETPDLTQTDPNTMEDLSQYVTHTATLETSAGPVEIALYGGLAPNTVENFAKLANEGFYDDTRFHRIIEGFMIQGGDPNTRGGQGADIPMGQEGAWGTGGPDYTFETEFSPLLQNLPGTIAMANAGGTDTNGSQFFINLVDNRRLDTNDASGDPKNCDQRGVSCHTAFGQVTNGMDIVETLGSVATDAGDKPLEDVVLQKVTVTEVAVN